MKRIQRLLIILLSSLMLVGCHHGGIASSTSTDATDSTGSDTEVETTPYEVLVEDPSFRPTAAQTPTSFPYQVGTWSAQDGVLTGTNASAGNCFALLPEAMGENTSFTLSADLRIEEGAAGGFVFGVKNKDNPGAAWYGVNIDRETGNTRLFSSGTGIIGAATSAQRRLTDEEKARSDFHLEMTVYADGTIWFLLDGVPVGNAYTDTEYSGGYLGFYTFKAKVCYSNITLKTFTAGGLSALDFENVACYDIYASDRGLYTGTVSHDTDIALLKLSTAKGQTIYVDGRRYPDSDKPVAVPVQPGVNALSIVVDGSDGSRKETDLILTRETDPATVYGDTYRPQYHFTAQKNWINDPNGLVYNADTGEYHMYYQYCPLGVNAGAHLKVWGHAVSTDLVNWKELPIAIDADKLGYVYSGCCVVDRENTSGFFDDTTSPDSRIVAIYSTNTRRVCLAYSPDGGYNFTKFVDNPVLLLPDEPFRDPKVVWLEEEGKWLMIIAGGRARLYTSTDLKTWTFHSFVTDENGTILEGECPDLFPLALDGNEDAIKWVYLSAGRHYYIGDLVEKQDGKLHFVVTQGQRTDYNAGTNAYATTSFYNDAKGRRLLVSWFVDSSAESKTDKNWDGMLTFPYETTLCTVNGSMKLVSKPIEELEAQYGEVVTELSDFVMENKNPLANIKPGPCKIELIFEAPSSGALTLLDYEMSPYTETSLVYDACGTLTLKTVRGTYRASLPPKDGKVKLEIYIDRSLIEIFANDGEVLLSAVNMQPAVKQVLRLFADASCQIDLLRVTAIRSIYGR